MAERGGLVGLSVNAVVAEAGLAKGTFYVHFTDRDGFLDALHERFYANIAGAIDAAVAGLPPGAQSLAAGIDAYLDACLAQRGVKPVLRELHGDACAPATAKAMNERQRASRPIDATARARAQLAVTSACSAMISETALLELEAASASRRARSLRRCGARRQLEMRAQRLQSASLKP